MKYEYGYYIGREHGTATYNKVGVAQTRDEAMNLAIKEAKACGTHARTFWIDYGKYNTYLCSNAVPVTMCLD